jgi:chemotaxis methyl-accepting protein methylase
MKLCLIPQETKTVGYHPFAAKYDRKVLTATRFYRNSPQLEVLFDLIIPQLRHLKGAVGLRIASMGCSTGCEPYSIAIEADRRGILGGLDITGCDVDPKCIKEAIWGGYNREVFSQTSPDGVVAVPEAILNEYFSPVRRWFKSRLRVKEVIRKAVHFDVLDVLKSPSAALGSFDVILFQNILLHFSREAADLAIENIKRMANPSAYLLIGGGDLDWMETVDQRFGLAPVTERLAEIHNAWLTRRYLYEIGDRSYLALEPYGVKRDARVSRYCSIYKIL